MLLYLLFSECVKIETNRKVTDIKYLSTTISLPSVKARHVNRYDWISGSSRSHLEAASRPTPTYAHKTVTVTYALIHAPTQRASSLSHLLSTASRWCPCLGRNPVPWWWGSSCILIQFYILTESRPWPLGCLVRMVGLYTGLRLRLITILDVVLQTFTKKIRCRRLYEGKYLSNIEEIHK